MADSTHARAHITRRGANTEHRPDLVASGGGHREVTRCPLRNAPKIVGTGATVEESEPLCACGSRVDANAREAKMDP